MYIVKVSLFLLAFALHSAHSYGQQDTSANTASVTQIPLKFITQTNNKIEKYTHRLTHKTEKTLEKLTKWENKIQQLLQKTSPQTAQQLFGEGKLTFAAMLAQLQAGKTLVENTKAKYNQYNDQLSTNVKYLESQKAELHKKYVQPLATAKQNINELDSVVTESETTERLIKERKKEVLTQAYKVLGKNKYIGKMQQECHVYTESLKNYKELFNEPGKAEKKAMQLLGQIPAVKNFVQRNSMLASLFGSTSFDLPPVGGGGAGLQTRSSVNTLIQGRIAAGGPNAAAQISANMQAAQAELGKLKDKYLNTSTGSSHSFGGGQGEVGEGRGEDGLPNFKKKEQKSKTFKQRLEVGSNMQFGKPNRYTSSQADLGMSLGYKVNDKSTIGVGISYKLNYGAIDNFYLQHGGVGLRSFMDWKIKKQFYLSGGYEMNYNQSFAKFSDIRNANGTTGIGKQWQNSGLVGLSKKIVLPSPRGGNKGGLVKSTKLQVLFDMFYNTHVVPTQPVVFRVGYNY